MAAPSAAAAASAPATVYELRARAAKNAILAGAAWISLLTPATDTIYLPALPSVHDSLGGGDDAVTVFVGSQATSLGDVIRVGAKALLGARVPLSGGGATRGATRSVWRGAGGARVPGGGVAGCRVGVGVGRAPRAWGCARRRARCRRVPVVVLVAVVSTCAAALGGAPRACARRRSSSPHRRGAWRRGSGGGRA